MEDTAKKRTYADLLSVNEAQREQIERYEKRLRDVVAAYKALQKEKAALDDVVTALAAQKKEEESDQATSESETGDGSKNAGESGVEEGGESQQENSASREQSAELNEAASKSESVSKLREKISALSNALATVTGEKNRLEQAYVSEKKLLRHEFDEKLAAMQRTIEEHEEENSALHQENSELKNKLRSAAHDYENMQLKANRDVQELHAAVQRARRDLSDHESRLSDANSSNERLKQRVSELDSQLRSSEAQLRNANLELDRLRVANENDDVRRKENEQHLERVRELETSVSSLRERLQRESSQGNDAKSRLERELNEVRRTYEERLRAFETHVAELSATVGRYETVRRDDAAAIEQMRARCAALASEKADLLGLLETANVSLASPTASDVAVRRKHNSSVSFERSNSEELSPLANWLLHTSCFLEETLAERSKTLVETVRSRFTSTAAAADLNAFDCDDFDSLVNELCKLVACEEANEQVRRFVRAFTCILLCNYASQSLRLCDSTERPRTTSSALHSLLHAGCIEHAERTRDDFEKYRLRAQAALRSSGSLIVLGNGSQSPGSSSSVVNTVRLGNSQTSGSGAALNAALVNELHSKLNAERDKHAQLEAELANMREFASKTSQLLKEQHSAELRSAEAKHRATMQNIESELQKTRSRTVQLLAEKDDEIALLQKRLEHALTMSSRQQFPLMNNAGHSSPGSVSATSLPFATASEPASLGGASTDRSSSTSPDAASCFDELNTTTFVSASASASASASGLLLGRAAAATTVNMIVVNEQHARLENELLETKKGRMALEKELKRVAFEYRNESQRNRELIGELQDRIAQLERERVQSSEAGAAQDTQYLKNVVYRYLLSDDLSTKKQIASAICMILRFSKQEKRTIEYFLREGRLPNNGT